MLRSTQSARNRPPKRRGIIILLTAFLIIVLMGVLALSIDTGYMYTMQTQLDRSVDAAALAGAGALIDGQGEANDKIVEYLVRNPVGSGQVISNDDQLAQLKNQYLLEHQNQLQMQAGSWNNATRQFEESSELPSAVRVSVTHPQMPLFFARVLGRNSFSISSESIATFQPRDIVLVLDLSGSMNDDSELKSINKLSQESIEANLFQIWHELGEPTFGNLQFEPLYISDSNTTEVLNQLELTDVPYPYPSGSWSDYVSYVKYSSNINNAGYRKKYGMLTLVNYWLEKKAGSAQTPDLWKGSAQPITAVKDAVDVFIDFLKEVDTKDQVALAVYDSANGEGQLEFGLTRSLDQVGTVTRARQAAHYHSMTNIGAGMRVARYELDNNARENAYKMMVLLTDGNANWFNGENNTYGAQQDVINEANLAKAKNIPILTISLGAGADTSLMDQVAEITEGKHYNVPGGQSVAEYRADLMQVFGEIAAHRPLKLVK